MSKPSPIERRVEVGSALVYRPKPEEKSSGVIERTEIRFEWLTIEGYRWVEKYKAVYDNESMNRDSRYILIQGLKCVVLNQTLHFN